MLKNSCQRPHAWRKRAKRICSRTCFTWYQPSSKTLVYGSDLPSVAEFEGSMIQYDPIWSWWFFNCFFQCISKHSKLNINIYIRSQSQVLPVPVTRNRRCGWVSGSQSLSNCKSFLHLCTSGIDIYHVTSWTILISSTIPSEKSSSKWVNGKSAILTSSILSATFPG